MVLCVSNSIGITFSQDYIGLQYTNCTPKTDSKTENEQIGVDLAVITGVQYTEKNTLEELEGEATSIGGDVFMGGDIVLDSQNKYMGWQWSGATGSSIGVHKTKTNTETICKIPTVNLPKKLRKWLFDDGD